MLATVAFALVTPDQSSEVRLVGLKLLQVNGKRLSAFNAEFSCLRSEYTIYDTRAQYPEG